MDIFVNRIIPVAVVNDADDAIPLAEALLAGGLSVVEVPLRTDAAAESIAIMSEVDGLLVGAGTVTSPPQVELAVEAGAKYLVSPGLRTDVMREARLVGKLIIPGAVTPSEIMVAQGLGVEIIHFFPANVYGGPATIKALAGLFHTMKFVPAGGITASNLVDYLTLPCVPAACGSWMVPADLIEARDFKAISNLCREAVELVNSLP